MTRSQLPIPDQRILLIAETGFGKSTLANDLGRLLGAPIFLSCSNDNWKRISGKVTGLACFGEGPLTPWAQFTQAVAYAQQHRKPDTLLVIDGLDSAYQACRAHVLDENHFRSESDGERGLGWTLVSTAWREWWRTTQLGGGFMLIDDAEMQEVVTPTRHYHRLVPVTHGRSLTDLLPQLDSIWCGTYFGEGAATQRRLYVQGSEALMAKSPLPPPSPDGWIEFDAETIKSWAASTEGGQ